MRPGENQYTSLKFCQTPIEIWGIWRNEVFHERFQDKSFSAFIEIPVLLQRISQFFAHMKLFMHMDMCTIICHTLHSKCTSLQISLTYLYISHLEDYIMLISLCIVKNSILRTILYLPAIKWLEYCRYGVKHHPINQSINLKLHINISVHLLFKKKCKPVHLWLTISMVLICQSD